MRYDTTKFKISVKKRLTGPIRSSRKTQVKVRFPDNAFLKAKVQVQFLASAFYL